MIMYHYRYLLNDLFIVISDDKEEIDLIFQRNSED